jgi:hypothetical protein
MATAPVSAMRASAAAKALGARPPGAVVSPDAKNHAFGPGNFMPRISSGPTNHPETDASHPVYEGSYTGGARTNTRGGGSPTRTKTIDPKTQTV